MKAYLIDPKAKTITEVVHNGDYTEIYKAIDADTFDVVGINNQGDCVYVDDEGLHKDPEFFFQLKHCSPIAGKGLVLGTDREGESVDPKISLEDLKALVTFSRKQLEGFEQIPAGATVDHPILGKIAVVGSRAILKDRKN